VPPPPRCCCTRLRLPSSESWASRPGAQGYYVNTHNTFKSLVELVAHHKFKNDGALARPLVGGLPFAAALLTGPSFTQA
jgi:hypothetical protein